MGGMNKPDLTRGLTKAAERELARLAQIIVNASHPKAAERRRLDAAAREMEKRR